MPDQHRAHEVTIGEVYRLALRIDQRLDQITKDMVGRQEYESDQESIERRLTENQEAVIALRKRVESTEAEQRASRSKWLQAVAIAALSAVLAVIVPLMLRGLL